MVTYKYIVDGHEIGSGRFLTILNDRALNRLEREKRREYDAPLLYVRPLLDDKYHAAKRAKGRILDTGA